MEVILDTKKVECELYSARHEELMPQLGQKSTNEEMLIAMNWHFFK